MFTTLMCLVAFSSQWPPGSDGVIRVTGGTDNAGNTSILSRLMTSKHPLVVVLAEVHEWVRRGRLDLGLDWYPRDQNEEADSLSNSDPSEFAPHNEVRIRLQDIRWHVLPRYMAAADELYREVKSYRMPAAIQQPKRGRLGGHQPRPLREADPW